MEDHTKNIRNERSTPPPGNRSKTDQRWTLLFIGNHGKTITLKRFKSIVLLSILVLMVSVAITLGLLYFSFNVYREKDQMLTELQELKKQIKALRYEKDVLMTKLVLAESRQKPDPPEKRADTSVPSAPPPSKIDSKTVETPAPPASVPKEPVKDKVVPKPVAKTPSAADLSVDVDGFRVVSAPRENLLRIQFKIKNTTSNSQRVSGHAIVVLKPDPLKQDKWLTIPAMALSNGKPTGRRRGYSFGINHFKTMRLKTNLPTSPEIYRHATVFVFTNQGEMLLEKDFPVSLPAAQSSQSVVPATPKPANSTTSPANAASAQPATPGPAMPSTDEPANTLKNTKTE